MIRIYLKKIIITVFCVTALIIVFLTINAFSDETINYINDTATEPCLEQIKVFDSKKDVIKWVRNNADWYCYINNTAADDWCKIDDILYLFDTDGKMRTGWQKYDNSWYYLGKSGGFAIGWNRIDDNWYYFKDTGIMAQGWILDGGNKYYLNESGAMVRGWLFWENNWYYMNDYGAMVTQEWIYDKDNWYYMDNTGAMARGWIRYKNNRYYLYDSGAMATGWIRYKNNWYYLDNTGAMATKWIYDKGDWYYFESTGAMVTGWLYYKNKWYYLQPSGAMATGWLYYDDTWYFFENSGEWNPKKNKYIPDKQSYSSSTEYLIIVYSQTNVFEIYWGSKDNWQLKYSWNCITRENSIRTPEGKYQIQNKNGSNYEEIYEADPIVRLNPLDDTIFYSSGFPDENINPLSIVDKIYGSVCFCGYIRLLPENEKWVYDNIPYGTRIIVY